MTNRIDAILARIDEIEATYPEADAPSHIMDEHEALSQEYRELRAPAVARENKARMAAEMIAHREARIDEGLAALDRIDAAVRRGA